MRQADVFLNGEGDAWLDRNRAKLGGRDPVSEVIDRLGIKPGRVLEVGCSDGWRLASLRDSFGCEVYGVEPSMKGCIEAAARRVPVVHSSAAVLCVPGPFDLVIYGFCLYMSDPAEWLRIAAEGDTVLAPDGYLIVYDFVANQFAYAKRYSHRDGLLAYHYDFAGLWMAHPQYSLITRLIHDDDMVTVLRKSGKIEVLS